MGFEVSFDLRLWTCGFCNLLRISSQTTLFPCLKSSSSITRQALFSIMSHLFCLFFLLRSDPFLQFRITLKFFISPRISDIFVSENTSRKIKRLFNNLRSTTVTAEQHASQNMPYTVCTVCMYSFSKMLFFQPCLLDIAFIYNQLVWPNRF